MAWRYVLDRNVAAIREFISTPEKEWTILVRMSLVFTRFLVVSLFLVVSSQAWPTHVSTILLFLPRSSSFVWNNFLYCLLLSGVSHRYPPRGMTLLLPVSSADCAVVVHFETQQMFIQRNLFWDTRYSRCDFFNSTPVNVSKRSPINCFNYSYLYVAM